MKRVFTNLLGSLAFIIAKAQISPPGLGKETNVGSWTLPLRLHPRPQLYLAGRHPARRLAGAQPG